MNKKISALCASLLVGLSSENGICMLDDIEYVIKKLKVNSRKVYSEECAFRELSDMLSDYFSFAQRIYDWREKDPTRKICLVLGDNGIIKRSRFKNDFCVYWDKDLFGHDKNFSDLLRGNIHLFQRSSEESFPPGLLGDATSIADWDALCYCTQVVFDAIHDDFNILGYNKSEEEKISLLRSAANVHSDDGPLGLCCTFFKGVNNLGKFVDEISEIYDIHEIPGDIESLCKVAPFGYFNITNNFQISYYSAVALIEGGRNKYNELSRISRVARGVIPQDMNDNEFRFINDLVKRMEDRSPCEFFSVSKEDVRKFRMANGLIPEYGNIVHLVKRINEDLGYYFTPENMWDVAKNSPLATVSGIQDKLDNLRMHLHFVESPHYVLIKKRRDQGASESGS
jgi:hypothetical protein